MTTGTISIRLVWPFTRLMKDYQSELSAIRAAGLSDAVLADPNARLPHSVVNELLRVSLKKTGDPALGLHAGELVESGDFGVLEYAARSCPDFRSALACCSRYMRLLDDEIDVSVIEEGELALWRIQWTGGERLPASNDFAVSSALTIGKRLLGTDAPPLEVHLKHPTATDAGEYARVFRAPVRLGMDANATVFPRAVLDVPLAHANLDLLAAFERQATQLLEQLAGTESVSARVRRFVLEQLSHGDVGMRAVARKLHMSSATLRRRLDDEGTTHRDILADVRRELALRHLANRNLAVSEVAFLLGFSSVGTFGRAFKRWAGVSPQDYRGRRGLAADR